MNEPRADVRSQKSPSLMRRLLFSSVVALVCIAAVGGLILRNNMQTITHQLMDANLIQFAQSLSLFEQYIEAKNNNIYDPKNFPAPLQKLDETLPLGDENLLLPDGSESAQLLPPTRGQIRRNAASYDDFNLSYSMVFQVWDKYGERLIVRSKLAPPVPMLPLKEAEQGFSDVEQEDKNWRIYTLVNRDGTRVIYVAHEPSVMGLIASEVVARIALPSAIILIVVLLVWLWIVVRGLYPLHRVSHEISERSTQHLAPLAESDKPVEIIPMVRALNRLMARLSSSLKHERQFTGNAAHELRTPLAVIDTLTQTAMLRQDLAMLPQIRAATHHARAQIEQLLTLARIDEYDTQAELADAVPISPLAVAQRVCADLMNIYGVESVDFELEGDETVTVNSTEDLLYILLRNLMENAIIHASPAAGEKLRLQTQISAAEVTKTGDVPAVVIAVSDNGAPIRAQELHRLTERFYRGGTGQTTQGFGIGLSIVKKICEVHRAQLHIRSRYEDDSGEQGQTGLRIEVVFGLV